MDDAVVLEDALLHYFQKPFRLRHHKRLRNHLLLLMPGRREGCCYRHNVATRCHSSPCSDGRVLQHQAFFRRNIERLGRQQIYSGSGLGFSTSLLSEDKVERRLEV